MSTYHIHISGQVQGVGFRPFIYKLAIEYHLYGWVNNSATGVHIEINCNPKKLDLFCELIKKNRPKLSIISNLTFWKAENKFFKDFRIIHSDDNDQPNLLLTPDYGICEDCRKDILDKSNKRLAYAFATCTNCGPRYSIIKQLPYDRENTTMQGFEMCSSCDEEYHNPLDRRYYSQTNSCPDCAVKFSIASASQDYSQADVLDRLSIYLKAGKIVAIKGIGGFLLLADATNGDTIKRLRQRKKRPYKPFALMYPTDKLLLDDIETSKKEWQAYKSIEAPIVLFQLKKQLRSGLKNELIAPFLDRIGVMQAYTPLYILIMQMVSFPVIATSANVSGSPIIYQNKKAESELQNMADLIVNNNREIVVPQDDSVIQFTHEFTQKIILRRSRSFSPTFIDPYKSVESKETLLGVGAGLKSSFCFYHQKNTYISQNLGNLLSFETQEAYEHTLRHFFELFRAHPVQIVCDYHPQYFSTQFAQQLTDDFQAKLHPIQHHKAHFAAVLAENNLIATKSLVMGIVWDGVGLGDDQQIWGGEFFSYTSGKMNRIAHFEYFKHLAFDKFAMSLRLPALSLCYEQEKNLKRLQNKFSTTEWKIYRRLLQKKAPLLTDSVGRIFDAVASLLNIKDENSYEGEAAILLEALAQKCQKKVTLEQAYIQKIEGNSIPAKRMIGKICDDIENGVDYSKIAYKFHLSLVKIIQLVAEKYRIRHLAFSGGVFQNSLLIDLIIKYSKNKYTLYFHQNLSPNDENISFGQLVFYSNNLK